MLYAMQQKICITDTLELSLDCDGFTFGYVMGIFYKYRHDELSYSFLNAPTSVEYSNY